MLKCVSKYSSSLGAFAAGDIIEDPKLEAQLVVDSEGSFVVVESREAAEAVEVRQAAIVEAKPLRKRRILSSED